MRRETKEGREKKLVRKKKTEKKTRKKSSLREASCEEKKTRTKERKNEFPFSVFIFFYNDKVTRADNGTQTESGNKKRERARGDNKKTKRKKRRMKTRIFSSPNSDEEGSSRLSLRLGSPSLRAAEEEVAAAATPSRRSSSLPSPYPGTPTASPGSRR